MGDNGPRRRAYSISHVDNRLANESTLGAAGHEALILGSLAAEPESAPVVGNRAQHAFMGAYTTTWSAKTRLWRVLSVSLFLTTVVRYKAQYSSRGSPRLRGEDASHYTRNRYAGPRKHQQEPQNGIGKRRKSPESGSAMRDGRVRCLANSQKHGDDDVAYSSSLLQDVIYATPT
ncbi:hypothetical protein BDW22DRAFT_159326 [Trametopsis cervina]|nr:hypothetical protein BDW22DRAFT_159326 [Trametopsis cervina]